MKKGKEMVFCSQCKKHIDVVLLRCADANVCSIECGYARLRNIELYDPDMVEPRIWHNVHISQANMLYVPNIKKNMSCYNMNDCNIIEEDKEKNEKITIDEENSSIIENKEFEVKIKKMILKKAFCLLCLVGLVVLNIA